jgi:hypothetical protein
MVLQCTPNSPGTGAYRGITGTFKAPAIADAQEGCRVPSSDRATLAAALEKHGRFLHLQQHDMPQVYLASAPVDKTLNKPPPS